MMYSGPSFDIANSSFFRPYPPDRLTPRPNSTSKINSTCTPPKQFPSSMLQPCSLIIVCVAFTSLAQSASDVPLSALEKYASSAAKASQNGAQVTSQERFEASAYELYLTGFFAGVSASQMIYDKIDEDHKITGDVSTVPEWMEDTSRSAPSFLAFVRRHCPPSADKQHTASSYILHAWYVFEHPKAQLNERMGGLLALSNLCKWGTDFPDADILQKKLTENFAEHVDASKQTGNRLNNAPPYHLDINGVTIDLPSMPGLWRLDGRMPSLDDATQKMAEAGHNRVLLLLGTELDHAAISDARFPTLERTLTIQQSTRLNRPVTLTEFEAIRDKLIGALSSKSFPESKTLFDQIGKATSDALQRLTEKSAKAALGEPQLFGVFDKDDLSFCHSMLAPGMVRVAEKEVKVTQATSVAVVYVQEMVLTVYASAKYKDAEDLAWTMQQAKLMRDKLLNR